MNVRARPSLSCIGAKSKCRVGHSVVENTLPLYRIRFVGTSTTFDYVGYIFNMQCSNVCQRLSMAGLGWDKGVFLSGSQAQSYQYLRQSSTLLLFSSQYGRGLFILISYMCPHIDVTVMVSLRCPHLYYEVMAAEGPSACYKKSPSSPCMQ